MEPLQTLVTTPDVYDLRRSLSSLRHGPADPTVRVHGDVVWRATRTPDGPVTVRYARVRDGVCVTAWGPGADHALATAPDVLGGRDDLTTWDPSGCRMVHRLHRRWPGVRFPATGAVFEDVVPTVLEQKVTSTEAHLAWKRMAWRWGDEAPGPGPVRLPPSADVLRGQPSYAFHRFGVEGKRADIIRRAADRARRIDEAAALPAAERRARLEAFPGIGPWTSALVAQNTWADADAVATGDYHLPASIVYAYTGRRDGTDDEMLELLEPFRPHRARAARLITMGARKPTRRAPKARLRDFRAS